MKFTDRKLKNLKPKPSRYEVWEGKGLGVRVSPTGRKTWVYLYHFEGRSRRMTLGAYPAISVAQAHSAHGQAMALLEKNIDPAATSIQEKQIKKGAPTIAALAHEYLERWAKPRKRSWREDERILEKDVLTAWGKRKAVDIRRRDVIDLLERIVDRGSPVAANRTFEIIRRMFNFAVERDLLETSPCFRVRAPAAEQARDRVLTDDELKRLWHKLPECPMSEVVRIALRLQLVTAQRRGEVATVRWQDIDSDSAWWTIPSERAKNALSHRVPLSPLALDLLGQAERFKDASGWVFPSPRDGEHINPRSMSRALLRARETIGIEAVTPHDLRRTAASRMTSLGIPRLHVSKVLNHTDAGVTAVYDRHSYDAEKTEALSAWATNLNQILLHSPEPSV